MVDIALADLLHPVTKIHDYRDTHRVKIQVEKEHIVMVVGYGSYLMFHSPVMVLLSYGLAMVFQGKAMVILEHDHSE